MAIVTKLVEAMDSTHAQKSERLTDAFQLFNKVSQNLSDSYQQLEAQVEKLNQELAFARNERLKTLVEKEKMATRLQQILAAIPAAVIILNAEEVIIDCNHHALTFLGEPLLGECWQSVSRRRLSVINESPHERMLADGRRVSIVRNALNNESGHLLLLSDISELRDLQDMLAQQKHLTAMGEMVAGMAHQVRTPLSTAILYASQLRHPNIDDDKRMQFSERILERLHHLERQVNDMLIFAKQGRMAMEVFSLAELLSGIRRNMTEFTVEFSLENLAPADSMLGNMDALQGALMNLLNNAVDAMAEYGKIEMSVLQTEAYQLRIVIKDNGGGMSAQQKQRIFEPFYSNKVKGTGLGLAVVDTVIKAHSGCLQCESTPGKGTTFTLTLPCVYQDAVSLSQAPLSHEIQEQAYETI